MGGGACLDRYSRDQNGGGSKMEMQRKQISYMHELATAAQRLWLDL